ncbi:hypothetical protein ACTXT7_005185, partial [Hymenolepis weldensis]
MAAYKPPVVACPIAASCGVAAEAESGSLSKKNTLFITLVFGRFECRGPSDEKPLLHLPSTVKMEPIRFSISPTDLAQIVINFE